MAVRERRQALRKRFCVRDREIKATVKSSTLVQGASLSLTFGVCLSVFCDVASMAFCTGPSVRKKERKKRGRLDRAECTRQCEEQLGTV